MSNRLQIVINDIAPDIPNTGRFTALTTEPPVSSAGGEPTALAFPIVLFFFAFMLGLLTLALKRRKDKKMHLEFDGECEELDRNFNRRFYLSVIGCATLFVSAGLSFMFLDTSKNATADEDDLTVNGSDIVIEIDRNLADKTTSYTVIEPATVTIAESTSQGYNLYAYTPSELNYLSSADQDNKSVILPLFDEDGNPNTASRYGISLNSSDKAYSLPAGKDNALLISSVSSATSANHSFTFNIEAIIDLDLPAGVYTGEIEYYAKRRNTIYMQEWDDCASLSENESIYLTDSRDENVYRITKLVGVCWMTQNLRLDFSNLLENISASNTNNPTSGFIAKANASPTSSTGEWNPYTYELKFNTDSIGDTTKDLTGHAHDDYGVYYNWYTATAGNAYAEMAYGENAAGDLCPSGWRLPTGGTNGEFNDLNEAINSGSLTDDSGLLSTFDFVYSGFYHPQGYPYNPGEHGELWSATSMGDPYAFTIVAGNYSGSEITVRPGTNSGLIPGGIPIRCIKKAPSPEPTPTQSHTLTVSYGTGVAEVTIDGSPVADGDSVTLEEGTSHSIDMTFASGYEFDSWAVTSGTLGSASTQSTTYMIGSTNATLTATGKRSCTPVSGTMQNFSPTSDTCETGTLIDNRTTNTVSTPLSYTVAKIGDIWWMTQNLAIIGTIPASGSNFSGDDFTIPADNLLDGTGYSSCYNTASSACYQTGTDPTENKPTAWYNYYAATVGTISGGVDEASEDICPSGWRLPTYSEQSSLSTAIGYHPDAFHPVTGGYYFGGDLVETSSLKGAWWSSTANVNNYRFYLGFDGSRLGMFNGYQGAGHYIRCVLQ